MLMTAEQRFDRALEMATAAGGENQTEAEFTAAHAAAERVLNLPTGFDIRFYNSKKTEETGEYDFCNPVDADTISLYTRDADGLAVWITDIPASKLGAARDICGLIYSELTFIVDAMIGGAKC